MPELSGVSLPSDSARGCFFAAFCCFFWAPSSRTLSPAGGHFVPVIVLHEFQQSFEFVVVPQIPFIVRVLDKSVLPQRQVRTVPNCAVFGRLHWCSSWTRLLTCLLRCCDRFRLVQTVQSV